MQTSEQHSGTNCMVKDGVPVEMQAVGAGAVNQAIKAIAISRGFLSPVGIEIACIPSFADIIIDGEYRTAIHFAIKAQYLRGAADIDSDGFASSLLD